MRAVKVRQGEKCRIRKGLPVSALVLLKSFCLEVFYLLLLKC